MKKILFAIMAVAAITFISCNGTAKGGAETDSIAADTVIVEDPTADVDATISALTSAIETQDTEQTQSLLQKAQEYIAKLQGEGKLEEAKAYIAKLQQFISENEETIASYTGGNETLSNIVSAVKAIPVDATTVAEDAKTAVEGAAAEAAQKATDAANAAADKAKEDASKAIDKAATDVKGKLGL